MITERLVMGVTGRLGPFGTVGLDPYAFRQSHVRDRLSQIAFQLVPPSH
ncbi:Uncharacterised protein [Mycobacteroides abscessus subsp. abscessus]|nr:Uncharacterised protein [Mycobacteroides abscessus subsp. abscessus]